MTAAQALRRPKDTEARFTLLMLEWLKEHPECRHVPKIVLSLSNDGRDEEKRITWGGEYVFSEARARKEHS